ncbi:hypothetical protein LTR66_011316 [Elasticomyces elasticus]|nr:hypothetical protein LTR66_011316 [Elasticomyces elasticus]
MLAPQRLPPLRLRGLRRLSSQSVTQDALIVRGPTVVVPPKHLVAPSDALDVAASIELARHKLEEPSAPSIIPGTPFRSTTTDKYAYAFDIDGVLLRGGRPIPEALEAIRMLNGQNSYGIKIQQLEIEVSPGQFICGHTPMREMAATYGTVLVVGGEGEKCRLVAEGYGFKDVVTPGDIIKDNPDTTPFRKLTGEEHNDSRLRDFSKVDIEAIFVFADSRDWAGDQQIILDLLMSENGRLGTRSKTFEDGPPVFFSHNDVVWSASHDLTRLGIGALRLSLEAMFKAITGKDVYTTAFGKPQIRTFQFATRLLQQWRKDTHGIDSPPDTVYFVGDTPKSDILGTNEFNKQSKNTWYSIVVRTGVYQEGTKPKFTPNATVDNVLGAVKHGMEREYKKSLKEAMKATESGLKEMVIIEESRPYSPSR